MSRNSFNRREARLTAGCSFDNENCYLTIACRCACIQGHCFLAMTLGSQHPAPTTRLTPCSHCKRATSSCCPSSCLVRCWGRGSTAKERLCWRRGYRGCGGSWGAAKWKGCGTRVGGVVHERGGSCQARERGGRTGSRTHNATKAWSTKRVGGTWQGGAAKHRGCPSACSCRGGGHKAAWLRRRSRGGTKRRSTAAAGYGLKDWHST
mmetsp:Transcript_16978/g.46967  ORF Transcript_16978/g.46967 Transcript_16978/m.46967 type:complete len:207 (-) Transcript_16978:2046-2666(-)